MRRMSLSAWMVIFTSIIIALLLTILPLPAWVEWFRPLWSLLIIAYWAIALEDKIGTGVAWIAGLLLDILGGTSFGEHALALCVAIFIAIKLRRQLRFFSIWQQAFILGLLSFLYQLIIFILQAIMQHRPSTFLFWAPIITTTLFWPWVFIILRDVRRRFNVV